MLEARLFLLMRRRQNVHLPGKLWPAETAQPCWMGMCSFGVLAMCCRVASLSFCDLEKINVIRPAFGWNVLSARSCYRLTWQTQHISNSKRCDYRNLLCLVWIFSSPCFLHRQGQKYCYIELYPSSPPLLWLSGTPVYPFQCIWILQHL